MPERDEYPAMSAPTASANNGGTASSRHFQLSGNFAQSSVFETVKQRFNNLEARVGSCALSLSIFPANSIIRKRVLIYWWIGEGFVDPLESEQQDLKTSYDIAEGVFDELLSKSFIEPVNEKKRRPKAKLFRLKPFVRLALVKLAYERRFFDVDAHGNFQPSFKDSFKACLVRSEQGSFQYMLRKEGPETLRTLFNVNESYIDVPSFWLLKAKNINVLQFGRWQGSNGHHIELFTTEFLEALGHLKHLRYLGFQGVSRIHRLPPSVSNLCNLKILDLRACHDLQKLPLQIGSLKKLEYLDVSECYLLEHMPKGIASLTELQVLKGFLITSSNHKRKYRLSSLASLKKLRKLSIYMREGDSTTDDELECLKNFQQLKSLTITWLRVTEPSSSQVLLNVPRRLEKLDLRCYPCRILPDSVRQSEMESLKKLYIRGGKLEDLGPRETNSHSKVEILHLKFLTSLKMNWPQLQRYFPNLIHFEKVSCPKLNLFPCDGHGIWRKDDNYKGDIFSAN